MLDRMAMNLCALRAADQFRELSIPAGIQLGSNDYLGLSSHPRLKHAIARALEEDERAASTGSRLLSGNHQRWEQLESEFADFVGAESALFFSSGYAANIGLLSSVLKPEDTVFSDASNHASLIDGIRLSGAKKVIFPHIDLNYLQDAFRRHDSGRKVVVIESIFSMDGDHAPMAALSALCERFDALLIVDEAHAVGVEGLQGRGLTDRALVNPDMLLATIHTCGKALAAMGAFVAGSRTLCEFLTNHARTFIFTTALPPYCAAHVKEGLALARISDSQRAHLRLLSGYLKEKLQGAGFQTGGSDSHIIPLLLGSNDAAVRCAAALCEAGFAVRPIRPPTVPAGTARLRLSLNAALSTGDLDQFMSVLVAIPEAEGVRE